MEPERQVLVLNCGSSSIKYALFGLATGGVARQPRWHGEERGFASDEQASHGALEQVLAACRQQLGNMPLAAVAHRVVHGGSRFCAPLRVDAGVLGELRALIPLAPLHQPFALDALATVLASWPEVPQIACFDTAFHRSLPKVEQMLPLPYSAWEHGLRRYGFHGLSYEFMAVALPERHGARARGRVIVAHLGSGASLCAMQDLRSVATTMGFSALDGLMMGTRCGAIDPGVLLHLMQQEQLSPARLGELLYHESGLLGVSGLSAEPRVLLEREMHGDAEGARARDALALYVRRIVRETGALVAVLGGLDLLVFTAGVGQHCSEIRRRICADQGYLGLAQDDARNQAAAPVISSAKSRVLVAVEATNEEWILARHAAAAA